MSKWIDYKDWKALREWHKERELSMGGYWVKSDLIGTEWKCPRCGSTEIITTEGIEHWGMDHFERMSLEILFWLKEKSTKQVRMNMYGY